MRGLILLLVASALLLAIACAPDETINPAPIPHPTLQPGWGGAGGLDCAWAPNCDPELDGGPDADGGLVLIGDDSGHH